MKTPAERGRTGAWAYEARQDADLSVEQVQERLARAGHVVTTATLRGVESGSKQPSRRLLRALAAVYKKPVPGDTDEPPADQSDLAAAIRENTDMLRKVLEALTARLPEPPPEVLRDLADAERDLDAERRRTTTLPRIPDHEPIEGRGRGRLRARTGE